MEVPVYLFTGFLEAGKTRFLQESLTDAGFLESPKDRALIIQCEEGEEELDPAAFASPNVFLETIDDPRRLNPDKLEALRRKHSATCVLIEYNGMWLTTDLFQALPEGWFIYQEMMTADASTIAVYNANMRNLVVDKLSTCDLVVFNRCTDDTDFDALHKLVRGVTRRANIIYEKIDGSAAYDDVEDPLPFDMDAPVVTVEDRDYALFYRDLADSMPDWNGKTVQFLGQVNKQGHLPRGGFVIGRPIMTCCVQDITFSGLFCEDGADAVTDGAWVRLTGKITVQKSRVYGRKGPVLKLVKAERGIEPDDPVATFY